MTEAPFKGTFLLICSNPHWWL